MRRSARVVLEGEGGEPAGAGLLEAAVADLGLGKRNDQGGPVADHMRDPAGLDSLREVRVVGEDAVAVTDREDSRDDLETSAARGRLHPAGVAEIVLVHAVEDLELVVGQHDSRVPALRGSIEQGEQAIDIRIDEQVGAAVDPPLGELGTFGLGGQYVSVTESRERTTSASRARAMCRRSRKRSIF